jgi:hypothetical protein
MAFIVDRDVEITKFTQGRRIRHRFFCFFLRQLADEFVLPIIAVFWNPSVTECSDPQYLVSLIGTMDKPACSAARGWQGVDYCEECGFKAWEPPTTKGGPIIVLIIKYPLLLSK